jgi:DNA-binding NtrC family response regulator
MAGIKEKILIVDDEETVRVLLKRILEGAGYEVVTAENGEEALKKLSYRDIHVVLTDIKMPGMTGIELLRHLNYEADDYCVIMITALTDAQTAVEAMKLGAHDYIVKPFDGDEVKSKLLNALEIYHRTLQEKGRQNQIQSNILNQTNRMQEQFSELVSSLAREHKLLHQLASKQSDGGKAMLSKLPKELQTPMASVDEFRDALIRILKRK